MPSIQTGKKMESHLNVNATQRKETNGRRNKHTTQAPEDSSNDKSVTIHKKNQSCKYTAFMTNGKLKEMTFGNSKIKMGSTAGGSCLLHTVPELHSSQNSVTSILVGNNKAYS
jgi:hypothetical protein